MHKIDINFRVSAQFNILLLMVILGSMLIILTLPTWILIKALLLTCTLIYGTSIFWRYGFLNSKQAVLGLKLNQDGWFLRYNSGVTGVELCGESTITLFACVLRFKLPNESKKSSCVVFNDSLKPDDYRRLVVQLRTSAAHRAEQVRRNVYLSKTQK